MSVDPSAVPDASELAKPPSKNPAASQNRKLLRALLPKLPLIARVAISHVLGLSESSKYLDLQSDVIIAVLRSFLDPKQPVNIEKVQQLSLSGPSQIKGKIWISTYTSRPPPETSARDVILQAVKDMAPNPEEFAMQSKFKVPEFANVEAEWTGYRAAAKAEDPLPDVSESARYQEMMKEVSSPVTVLYLHGGAYYLMDPSTHRPTVKKLAKLTSGRCFSVRYRLAPQHAFPAALLDAFTSYLTLLYPPPDAFHEAVRPEHIVVAGDSAGGNLSLALLQLLLELRRKEVSVKWYGRERSIPLPAAAACNSPWLDITHSLVSRGGDVATKFDYIPRPKAGNNWVRDVRSSAIWPADPPRRNLYADDHLVMHPLVSPVVSRDWSRSPPIYICTGWEMLATEDKYFAKKLAAGGVPIVFEEYEGMPHCFAMVLTKLPGARRCFKGWSEFIRDAVENPLAIQPSAVSIKAKTLKEIPLRFEDLSQIQDRDIQDMIQSHAVTKEKAKL